LEGKKSRKKSEVQGAATRNLYRRKKREGDVVIMLPQSNSRMVVVVQGYCFQNPRGGEKKWRQGACRGGKRRDLGREYSTARMSLFREYLKDSPGERIKVPFDTNAARLGEKSTSVASEGKRVGMRSGLSQGKKFHLCICGRGLATEQKKGGPVRPGYLVRPKGEKTVGFRLREKGKKEE